MCLPACSTGVTLKRHWSARYCYGGEEFALILPEAPLQATQRRAEELRAGISSLRVEYRGQPLGTITLSLGVAIFPDHGLNRDALLRTADAALYRAKAEGRNRAGIYDAGVAGET